MTMARAPRIPDRGDVPSSTVARLLGLSLADFKRLLPDLGRRNFPKPDPTTGHFCIEAVDRWRLGRHPTLFPMLTAAATAIHAGSVFDDRLRRMGEGDG
jgi:hypothetical protein